MKQHRDLILVLFVIGILAMLFVPVPPFMLDILLIFNFSIALLILLLTFYTDKPTKFSTFPSLLLIVTLFRLALNIASTRLILNDGQAGQVIDSVGRYVIGGNYVVGLVVFFILILVQYVVVTNGAQRVAEVAARFTLDSMPGKQMSIDAELNMGIITETQARERRVDLERDANFYGSMDGASKFVKGDAIAGIVLIFINIIGGLAVGVAQHGLSWGDAVHTYTLLTVGDGIVTQIPALIISTATGLLITRAATDASLSEELGSQMASSPKSLALVATLLTAALLLPGLPKIPLLIALSVFVGYGVYLWREKRQQVMAHDELQPSAPEHSSASTQEFDELLAFHVLELVIHPTLEPLLQQLDPISPRFDNFRQQYARSMGFVLPTLHISKSFEVAQGAYQLRMHGAQLTTGRLEPDALMVIDHKAEFLAVKGTSTKEPAFGLSAMWVEQSQEKAARSAGYTVVDPTTVLMTHLTEVIKQHAYQLLSRQETDRLIKRQDTAVQALVDEVVPTQISLSDIQKVLQILLQEKVTIRPLPVILESIAEHCRKTKDPSQLVEAVRSQLKLQLVEPLLDKDSKLHVLTMDGTLEQKLVQSLQHDGARHYFAMDPRTMEYLIQQLTTQAEKMLTQRLPIVLMCYPQLRQPLKNMLDRVLPSLHVISVNEVPTTVSVKNAGLILAQSSAA